MIDYSDYDVDNIDLENEMYLNDIQEEIEQEAEEMEELEEEQSTFDENYVTTEKDLDYIDKKLRNEEIQEKTNKYEKLKNTAKCKKCLDTDLKLDEYKRQIYQINYLGVNYTGMVIHKLYEDNYVFSVTSEDNTIKDSLKKINLTKL